MDRKRTQIRSPIRILCVLRYLSATVLDSAINFEDPSLRDYLSRSNGSATTWFSSALQQWHFHYAMVIGVRLLREESWVTARNIMQHSRIHYFRAIEFRRLGQNPIDLDTEHEPYRRKAKTHLLVYSASYLWYM